MSQAVTDAMVYRCTSCGEVLMEHEVDGSKGHTRTRYDRDGNPVPMHCGPVRATCEAGEDVKDMGESEAKAPETADQPVESAARRLGTKYEAVAQASQVAHHYIVPPPRDLSLIRFALHGLMERAYWLAAAAAQDISGRHFKPGAAEAFLKDAEDAEALLGRLNHIGNWTDAAGESRAVIAAAPSQAEK